MAEPHTEPVTATTLPASAIASESAVMSASGAPTTTRSPALGAKRLSTPRTPALGVEREGARLSEARERGRRARARRARLGARERER